MKGDAIAKIAFQLIDVHVRGTHLHRIEYVHAQIDQIREQGPYTPARVLHDLQVVGLGQAVEPPQMRHDERAEIVGAHKRALLGPIVVADEKDVQVAFGRLEHPAGRLVVIVGEPTE